VTRLLLDTMFLVDAERARHDLDPLIDEDDDVAIAAISIAELRVGVLLADERRRLRRQSFLDDALSVIHVVDYDQNVAAVHAELLVEVRDRGSPRGAHDLIIAATARCTRRTVVTNDASAFTELTGVTVRSH
jgi:tRNA(fMet)-specific endonuclease VapC